MKNRNIEHSDNWETPEDFYNKINDEFNFDFDPCPLFSKFDGIHKKYICSRNGGHHPIN